MKKFWILTLAAAALLAGCSKEQSAPVARKVTLTATVEDAVTRSAVTDEGKFSWVVGDQIAVPTTAGFETFTAEGNGTNNFTGEIVGSIVPGTAYYPATIAKDASTVVLPKSYKYVKGENNAPMQAIVTQTGGQIGLGFSNLCGMLKIPFGSVHKSMKQILVITDRKVKGEFTIEDGQINAGPECTDTVRVTFGTASNYRAITFYVPMPCGTYNNVKIILQVSDGGDVSFIKTMSGPLTVNRGDLILFGPADVKANPTLPDAKAYWPHPAGSSFNVYLDGALVESGNTTGIYSLASLPKGSSHRIEVATIENGAESPLRGACNFTMGEMILYDVTRTTATLEWDEFRPDRYYTFRVFDGDEDISGSGFSVEFSTSGLVHGSSSDVVPCRQTISGLEPGKTYKFAMKEKQGEDEGFSFFEFTTLPDRTPVNKEVFYQGFDDCFWGGDCANLAYSLGPKAAKWAQPANLHWPLEPGYATNSNQAAVVGPGGTSNLTVLFNTAKNDASSSLYGWKNTAVEMHPGYLKIGAGSVDLAKLTTNPIGSNVVCYLGGLSATTPTFCTITANVMPRTDYEPLCAAKVDLVVLHENDTEDVVISGFDVLTGGDPFNYVWKEMKATKVRLLSTDRLVFRPTVNADEFASWTDDQKKAFGTANRFNLDDILIVKE